MSRRSLGIRALENVADAVGCISFEIAQHFVVEIAGRLHRRVPEHIGDDL